MGSSNPYCICTWESMENCEDCNIKGKLHCHLDKKYSILFGIPFFVAFIPTFVGLILLGFPFNLISTLVWIGYIIFFFVIWEPPILCAHCPFYAEGETKILHCSINYGFLKTAKFKPGPTSLWEKIQFLIGANLIFAIPAMFLILEQKWYYLGVLILGIIAWYIIIQLKICTDCINFSCILNRVPKEIRDEFLKKNPIMYDAWKASGYKFDE